MSTTPFFSFANGYVLYVRTENSILYHDIIEFEPTNTLTPVTLNTIINLRASRDLKGNILTLPSGMSSLKRIMIRDYKNLSTLNLPSDLPFQTSISDISVEGTSINNFTIDIGSTGTLKTLSLSNNEFMRSIVMNGAYSITALKNIFINNCPLTTLTNTSEIFTTLSDLYLSGTNIVSLGGYSMPLLQSIFISPKFLNQNFDTTSLPNTVSVVVREDVELTSNQTHVHVITL
jgi:hypothetical protein